MNRAILARTTTWSLWHARLHAGEENSGMLSPFKKESERKLQEGVPFIVIVDLRESFRYLGS